MRRLRGVALLILWVLPSSGATLGLDVSNLSPEPRAPPLGDALQSATTHALGGVASLADLVSSARGAFERIATGAKALLSSLQALLLSLLESIERVGGALRPTLSEREIGWGVALGVAAGGGRMGGILSPLYSRLHDRDILKSPVRMRIHRYVSEHPGATPTEISRQLDLGWGTTVYHLSLLEERKILRSVSWGQGRHYFVCGSLSPEAVVQKSALRHPQAQRIARHLASHPSSTQKEIASALGMSSALVSWHIQKLRQAGVLDVQRSGRTNSLVLKVEALPS